MMTCGGRALLSRRLSCPCDATLSRTRTSAEPYRTRVDCDMGPLLRPGFTVSPHWTLADRRAIERTYRRYFGIGRRARASVGGSAWKSRAKLAKRIR